MSIFSKQYDVSMIQTTSKDALKRSALFVCGGDIAEAEKMYNYFAKDMADMPPYDPPQTSGYDKFKEETIGLLGWLDANQERILNYVNIFKSLRGGGGIATQIPADIPPIP